MSEPAARKAPGRAGRDVRSSSRLAVLRGRICASAKTGIRSASPMLASMVPMHRRGAQGSCAVLQRSEQALAKGSCEGIACHRSRTELVQTCGPQPHPAISWLILVKMHVQLQNYHQSMAH